MSIKIIYKCDRCGIEDFNQFSFCTYNISGTFPKVGHLCDKCREKVVKILEEKL